MAYVEVIPSGQTQRQSTPLRERFMNFVRGTKPEPAPPPPEGKVTFNKNAFIKTGETGVQTNETGEPLQELSSAEVHFDEKLVGQYERFLSNYAAKLAKLKEMPPPPGSPPGVQSMFDAVLANPNHQYEVKLYNELIGADGRPERGRIEKLLETAEGWMLTTALMDNQRAMSMAAMGFVAASDPSAARADIVENGQILLGTGQGRIHRWYNNLSHDQQNTLHAAMGLSIGGMVGGSITGGPIGALVGGVGVPLGVGAVRGISRMFDRGGTIDIEATSEALHIFKGFPEEEAYLKAMFGVDLEDFEAAPGGGIQRTNRYAESDGLVDAFNESIQMMYSRQDYLRALGIPEDRTDIVPEQFLYDPDLNGYGRTPEQTRTYIDTRIRDVFNPNRDGIRDMGGRARQEEVPPGSGHWVDTIGFDPNNLDLEGNLRRLMIARQKVINEMIDQMIQKQLDHESDVRLEGSIRAIDEKIRAREQGGELDRKAKEKAQAERQLVSELIEGVNGKDGIRQEIGRFDEYQQALDQLNQVRERIRLQFGTGVLADIEAELQNRSNTTPDRIRELREQLEQVEGNLNVLRRDGATVDQLTTLASNELNTLVGFDKKLKTAGRPIHGLTQSYLATHSVEDIMRVINSAHADAVLHGVPGVGWAAEFNADPTRRLNLYLAIAEARARVSNPNAFKVSTEVKEAYKAGITENELRILPLDEIVTRINALGPFPGLGRPLDINADAAMLQGMVTEAQTRFAIRNRMVQEAALREQAERTSYNARAATERTDLQARINQDRQDELRLRQEEQAVDRLRNPTDIAAKFAENNSSAFFDSYKRIEDWHAMLAPAGFTDLDPANIHTLTLEQLRDRINAARGINALIALPPDPEAAKRFLLTVRAEAQARHAGGALLTDNNPATDEITKLGVTARELRREPPERIIQLINDRNQAKGGFSNWQDDRAGDTRKYIWEAKNQAIRRFDARRDYLLQNMNDARAEVLANPALAPDLGDAHISFMSTNPDYQAAVRTLEEDLLRLGVTNSGELRTRITNDMARLNFYREFGDITAELNAVRTLMEGYATNLDTVVQKRAEIAKALNGRTTLAQIDQLLADRARIPDQQLQELRTAYLQAQEAFAETGNTAATKMAETARRMDTAYTELTAIAGPPAINADTLRDRSVAEIMRLINRANKANTAEGWPEAHNNRPEVRIRLLSAIAEARAAVPPASPILLALFGNGYNENQLVYRSSQEIQAELTAAGVPMAIVDIETVQQEVRNRIQARRRGWEQTLENNTNRLQAVDGDIANPNKALSREVAQLQLARDMIVRRGENLARMRDFVRRVGNMTESAPVGTGTTELSPNERKRKQPRGYYEILNLLFNYQQAPNRGEMFDQLYQTLPPRTLAREIHAAIPGLPPLGAGTEMRDILDGLRDGIQTGRVSAHELRNAVRRITNHYNGIALAMAA